MKLHKIEDNFYKNFFKDWKIPPNFKLGATIIFVTIDARYMDLQYQFHIHQVTLFSIIPGVCDAIYKRLQIRKKTCSILTVLPLYTYSWKLTMYIRIQHTVYLGYLGNIKISVQEVELSLDKYLGSGE